MAVAPTRNVCDGPRVRMCRPYGGVCRRRNDRQYLGDWTISHQHLEPTSMRAGRFCGDCPIKLNSVRSSTVRSSTWIASNASVYECTAAQYLVPEEGCAGDRHH